jgi:[acyl-carrier-protein] S-malonyltransferase
MRLAILCSGQAGQHRSMLDELLVAPDCALIRQAASDVLEKDVAQWWKKLDEQQIFLNSNAQFAIAFYQMATWARLAPLLPQVNLIAGYSLGELIGYHVAGALSATETFKLVRARALLMDESAGSMNNASGCMVLWRGRVSPSTLAARDRAIAEYGLDVAIRRKSGEEIFAGSSDAIAKFVAEFKLLNPNLVQLPVTIPAHSHYLAKASTSFRDILNLSSITAPQLTILGTVEAKPIRSREEAINALSQQISATLRWDECMQALAESGIEKAIELGPGNDLAKLLGSEHPHIAARSVEDFGNYKALVDWLNIASV